MDERGSTVTIPRRSILGAIVAGLLGLGIAPGAQAAGPYQLVLDQGSAFSILGRSCGGIQEESFATGFAPSGYPAGNVNLSTRCGGSGRGGGYKTTTYTASASVVWNWFGHVRSYARLEGGGGGSPSFEQTDAHGDRIYNAASRGYLETGEPPLQPPDAPGEVAASVAPYEVPGTETEHLRMYVSWSPAPDTAALLTSSTVTATPVKPGPPVLTATVDGNWTTAALEPVSPNTAYVITVTSSDEEGTSAASAPLELTSPNEDGEKGAGGGGTAAMTCETASGTIKLSPGLSETPHVQNITLKGELNGCGGPSPAESASIVAHLQTTEEVTCLALASLSFEPTTAPVSAVVKWAPKEAGTSHGSLTVPITEAGEAILGGSLQGGPFSSPAAVSGAVYESFTGAATCGVAQGKKQAKPVKSGTFSGSSIELG
ncbi:MAG: hypothetical protein JWM60_335 [Solirubrobacterales bacterium]|nr:hypothetical protein [Solirubrobacterales bacterium]